ncbi:MAG: MATE family efflux transporter [Rhodospirillales bacterium]
MQLAQIGIHSVEIVYAGRLGPTYLAAATVGSQTFYSVFLFLLGVAIAVAPMVSQARGRGAFREIRRTVRQGLWAVTLLCLPSMALLWQVGPLMLLLGQDPAVAQAAEDFTRPMTLGLPAWIWYFVLRNFSAALDRPRPALYAMLVGIVVNALVGYALVFGAWGAPQWGIAGAGTAAALSAWVVFLGMLATVLLDRRLRRFRIFARLWRSDWPLFKEINRVGLPIGVALFFETSFFMAALFLQGLIGVAAQAAHGAAIQLIGIAFMLPLGVAQAGTIRIGLAVGRNDQSAAGRAAVITYGLGLVCTLTTAAILLLFPVPLMQIFQNPDHPQAAQVIQIGVTFLAVGALFQLVDGGQVIAMGCLRGFKDTKIPMFLAAFGYWAVGLPLSIWLGFETDLAGVGIWVGLAAGLTVAALLLTRRFYRLWRAWTPAS